MNKILEYKNLIGKLLKLVDPLKIQMLFAILFGSLGHIFASLLPSLGIYYLANIILKKQVNFNLVIISLLVLAILRALLKYSEQLLNHYIAFKTLAVIRDKVFKKLRAIGPQKIQGKDKGKLISILTSDIELLEVFYAHTISPVSIAFIHTLVFFIILWKFSPIYSLILLTFHIILALIIPIITEKLAGTIGKKQRENYSVLNSLILESFKGIKEIVNFLQFENRYQEIKIAGRKLRRTEKILNEKSAFNFILSGSIIIFGNLIFILTSYSLYRDAKVDFIGFVFPIAIFISSFGPTSALSNLANNLILTLACGNRVINLLEEEPQIEYIKNGENLIYEELSLKDVNFSYDSNKLIENFNLKAEKNQIIGLEGKSGCGKSTIMKLIMRFYPINKGTISINNININKINTKNLRDNISYLSQDVHLFKATIRDNLKIAKKDATDDELISACKKANIYDFIESLENGFDTEILKDKFEISTGQAQRLGLARIFLRNSNLYILDEPTANIDALNEGIILKSLYDQRKDKTIIISSHRGSSLRITDTIIELKRQTQS